MATVKEFVDFWIETSVHPDEQLAARRLRDGVEALADKLIDAGAEQGFSKQQIEAELGDIPDFIKTRIKSKNDAETLRLRGGK